jgi:hypothetical protein
MADIFMTILSILSTVCAIIFGYIAFSRNKKKDDADEGKNTGTILTELGYIKGGIDDVKAEQKEQRKTNTGFVERLVSVEASAKQAHKRLDSIEGRRGSGDDRN